MYLALGGLVGISGSNSTGKPKKPLNLSNVTWATCLTLVGHPMSIPLQSLALSLFLQLTHKDFLKRVTKNANKDSWSLLFLSLSFISSWFKTLEIDISCSSSDWDSKLCREDEDDEVGEDLITSVMAVDTKNVYIYWGIKKDCWGIKEREMWCRWLSKIKKG